MGNFYFEQYKKIPQYKLLNFNMTLNEFKIIFYWEYFHRILAKINRFIFFNTFNLFLFFQKKLKKNI